MLKYWAQTACMPCSSAKRNERPAWVNAIGGRPASLPPRRGPASSSVTSTPRSARWIAAESPARPPPTTITGSIAIDCLLARTPGGPLYRPRRARCNGRRL